MSVRGIADIVMGGSRAEPATDVDPTRLPAELVVRLCDELDEASVRYCHWKSNAAIDKSATGENDLDLLVDRRHASNFNRIVSELGFLPLDAPRERAMPGVVDLLGYDNGTDRFIHIQAHYQLILGHDATKNYRLALEEQFLASATRADLFPFPRPNTSMSYSSFGWC